MAGLEGEPSNVAQRVALYVVHHEGAHFREVQRNVGLGTGQADHHLRRLQRQGLLARTDLGGEAHYFPTSRPRPERKPLAALRHPARFAAADALLHRGPSALRHLAEETGVPESTLSHHLRALLRAGVVYRVQEARHVAYGLSDPVLLRQLMALAAQDATAR